MALERTETSPAHTPPAHAPASAASRREAAGPAALEQLQIEALILNLDASLRVHVRPHFFNWAQGLLQSLIRHEVLVCALRGADARSLRVDSFATAAADAAIFGELFLRDASAAPGLLKEWRERGCRPLTCGARQGGALCGGDFARELERIGATDLTAHGTRDADGQVGSFFVFASHPGSAGPAQAYLVQLVLPSLHAAWVRVQIDGNAASSARSSPASASLLTPRELEILRWISIGKSNFEVGAILNISPLTVKNHVQKILRKLNVVNRTQAVGKVLESRLITL
jgi:transcriptional regulator EpsA